MKQFSNPLELHPDMPHEMQTAVNDLAYAMDKFWHTIHQIENSTGIDPRDEPWRITFVGALQARASNEKMQIKESVVGCFPDAMHLLSRTQSRMIAITAENAVKIFNRKP